jgi:hypothetical protein
VTHSQHGDDKESALQVWDSPNAPITADIARELVSAQEMPDGPAKKAAIKALTQKHSDVLGQLTERVFVGRTIKDDAAVLLMDKNGKPRIRLAVDSSNVAALQFLDESGKVVSSLPQASH